MTETLVVLILTYSNGAVMTSQPIPHTECTRMQGALMVINPKPRPEYRVVRAECK